MYNHQESPAVLAAREMVEEGSASYVDGTGTGMAGGLSLGDDAPTFPV